MFQKDAEDRINFRSFATGLSIFNETARPATKADFVFRLFDVDGDGFLNEADLSAILASMTGKSLNAETIQTIVQRTMQQADVDRDGRISKQDFLLSMSHFPWDELIVPVKKLQRAQYLEETTRLKARVGSTLPLATVDS